jgi:hypothetical protein
MTNKIMELAHAYATQMMHSHYHPLMEARAALATEVQAHIDYTKAVVSERDEMREKVSDLKVCVQKLYTAAPQPIELREIYSGFFHVAKLSADTNATLITELEADGDTDPVITTLREGLK